MQRKEFENRIKSLLLKAADDVVESWAEYATELDQDGTEATGRYNRNAKNKMGVETSDETEQKSNAYPVGCR